MACCFAPATTELVLAAGAGNYDAVFNIVESGTVPVDCRDGEGSTPLIAAAYGGHVDIVRYLLAKGADVSLTNSTYSWTALIAASAEGHKDVVQELLDHGADPTAVDIEVRACNSVTGDGRRNCMWPVVIAVAQLPAT